MGVNRDICVTRMDALVGEVLQAVEGRAFLVVCMDNGRFAELKPADLRLKVKMWDMFGGDLKGSRLRDLPSMFWHGVIAPALRLPLDSPTSRETIAGMEVGDRAVVLDQAGEVVGVYEHAGVDRGWRVEGEYEALVGGDEEVMLDEGMPAMGGVLSADDDVHEAAKPEATEAAETRYVNVEVLDRRRQPMVERPLQVGQSYSLVLDVDVVARETSVVGPTMFDYAFAEGEEEVEITVRLQSADFDIRPEEQMLIVPRTGLSINQATFIIKPRREGEGVINAVLLKGNIFIQAITIRLPVGQTAGGTLCAETLGRSLSAAFASLPSRELTITVMKAVDGYTMWLAGATAAAATLPITRAHLKQMITRVRQALLDIVYTRVGPNRERVYQTRLDIPLEVHQQSLVKLAKAGYRLYQQLFYGPAADAQTQLMGDRLRQMTEGDPMRIQVVAQDFVIPWSILYLAEDFDPARVRLDRFLGLKHVIEHIPLQNGMQVLEPVISTEHGVRLGLQVNKDIDQQMGVPIIAGQVRFFEQLAQQVPLQVTIRDTEDEVVEALNEPTDDQIMYFYVHAVSKDLEESGGPDASKLVFTGHQALTLEDLYLEAPPKRTLPGTPLVFINACESAELSPLFYDGFVRYFMAKGARGVIGTECEVPALFAAEFARRFFRRFLQGELLGQACLALRREFLEQHNNLLGLLYALYVDGDTRLHPPVLAVESAP